jgi:hypothetical protein
MHCQYMVYERFRKLYEPYQFIAKQLFLRNKDNVIIKVNIF